MNKKLVELSEKVKRKEKIDIILDELMIEKDRIQGRIYDLEARLEQEEIDVVNLEEFSLQNMWFALLGKKDRQLEKEKQEVYDVQMQLASARNQFDIVKREINRYETELDSLGDCEEEYREELEKRINDISFKTDLSEEDRVVILEKLSEIAGEKKEITEAITAGKQSLEIVYEIQNSLKSAKDWSVADMFTDSLIMTIVKRDKMNNAQDGIYRLQHSLTHFKSELTDVSVNADINVVTDSFLDIADYWLDGLFIDWMVHDKIKTAQANIEKTEARINLVLKKLNEQLTRLNSESAKHDNMM